MFKSRKELKRALNVAGEIIREVHEERADEAANYRRAKLTINEMAVINRDHHVINAVLREDLDARCEELVEAEAHSESQKDLLIAIQDVLWQSCVKAAHLESLIEQRTAEVERLAKDMRGAKVRNHNRLKRSRDRWRQAYEELSDTYGRLSGDLYEELS